MSSVDFVHMSWLCKSLKHIISCVSDAERSKAPARNVKNHLLLIVVVVVDCGLTSHSAIFQLYSDGTDVQFPNFDLLPGTHAMGS